MSENRASPCPVPGCDATVPPEHGLCLRHWRLLPPAMQQDIVRARRIFNVIVTDAAATAAAIEGDLLPGPRRSARR